MSNQPQERLEHMLQTLRTGGNRITPQRMIILKILAESRDHPSVDGIYAQVKTDYPTTSLATVYKTINLLKQSKEVLELGFADWGSRYDGKRPYPHPHVICTKCGAIVDADYAPMEEMAREMAAKSGYEITHHRLDFFGLCPNCRKKG